MTPLRPGSVVTCSRCGASSRPAHTTGGPRFEEGGSLVVTWDQGPYPRHEVAAFAPDLCLWCAFPETIYPARRVGVGGSCSPPSSASPPPAAVACPSPLSSAGRQQLALFAPETAP